MKYKYLLPLDEVLESHIENHYQATKDEKFERYKYIWQAFGPPEESLIVGGISAYLAIKELRLCFIEGYYLACVLLAQVFIENSLGGNYILAGLDSIAESGFSKLINQAEEDNIIGKDLASRLHELRLMRNPYVHPKSGAGNRTIMKRILNKYQEGGTFESAQMFAEKDAKFAIETLVNFLQEGRVFGSGI